MSMAYDMQAVREPVVGAPSDPATLAAALNAELRDATPQEILKVALERFVGRVALVSSFGAESAVLLHMLSELDPGAPVLFLDTGHLFGQTLDYRKSLTARLGLTDVRDLRPSYQDLATQDPKADLWKTDTDACCAIRKVAPLDRVLLPDFDAWITGRKRFHGGARLSLPVVEAGAEGKIKFNPLANWNKAQLDAYMAEHELPPHPLVEFGYPSVGCWPCTKPVEAEGEVSDIRAGRWAGSEKTECGIHTPRSAKVAADAGDVGGDI
jgi:phosphoadenosine phosphosulfate reductase